MTAIRIINLFFIFILTDRIEIARHFFLNKCLKFWRRDYTDLHTRCQKYRNRDETLKRCLCKLQLHRRNVTAKYINGVRLFPCYQFIELLYK